MLPFSFGGPLMHIIRGTPNFQAPRPFLRFLFTWMATGGPPMVHRWECPGLLMASGWIPWSLSTGKSFFIFPFKRIKKCHPRSIFERTSDMTDDMTLDTLIKLSSTYVI